MTGWLERLLTDPQIAGNLESVFTIAAILVGGWWTYALFVRERRRYPRAKLSHVVRHRVLPDDKRLIQAGVLIQNSGSTLLRVGCIDFRIQHVAPLTAEDAISYARQHPPLQDDAPSQVPWSLLARRVVRYDKGEREIEPGEEELVSFDFIVPDDTSIARVYSHVENVAKRTRWKHRRLQTKPIGWTHSSLIELRPEEDNVIPRSEQSLPEQVPERTDDRPEEQRQTSPEPVPPARPSPSQPAETPGGDEGGAENGGSAASGERHGG